MLPREALIRNAASDSRLGDHGAGFTGKIARNLSSALAGRCNPRAATVYACEASTGGDRNPYPCPKRRPISIHGEAFRAGNPFLYAAFRSGDPGGGRDAKGLVLHSDGEEARSWFRSSLP